MQRNHTIIGISDAVVVVEAGETGGSMATGVETLKAGKMLFSEDRIRSKSIIRRPHGFPACLPAIMTDGWETLSGTA